MDVIRGPITQLAAGGLIYQVTLASGMIVTSPGGFGSLPSEPRQVTAPPDMLAEATRQAESQTAETPSGRADQAE